MQHTLKILNIKSVTHDVKAFTLEKPNGYKFTPGQATEVVVNKPGFEDKARPFTFTSLNEDENLEFIIKGYFDHEGVTKKIHSLEVGDELIIGEPWGTINYKGKGVFIAGGAGITPFIAILRQLDKNGEIEGNKLVFSNKTEKDIILKEEFENMFSGFESDLIFTLTDEDSEKYFNKFVDTQFIKDKINNFEQNFYVCGPPQMVKDLKQILTDLGAPISEVVFEK